MVRLDGEKMSKSRGNLVFVSRLLAAGNDPMAIRLAIIAHHYAEDWDWTEQGLAAASARLARWRRAVALATTAPPAASETRPSEAPSPAALAAAPVPGGPVPAGPDVLAAVRARLADDLDAPGAIAAVDSWAAAVLAAAGSPSPEQAEDAWLVAATVDALLGIELRPS
jgi:L-cysteine:1D-myo-inositol 2-amino-2-deoxy-alpha-D-glucopyranoside ligase